jgi:hypothetical protein
MFGNEKARSGLKRRDLVALAGGAVAVSVAAPFVTQKAFAAAPLVRRDAALMVKDVKPSDTLRAAVKEMQDRSAKDLTDPKGWRVNANAHRDFCSIPSSAPSQIHFCWWFLPWHRAYIHVTEQKLRAISGDKNLTYPYWNWSSDRRIPALFGQQGSPLANAIRYTPNRGLTSGEVDYHPDDPILKKLVVGALEAHKYEAADAAEIRKTFGGIARLNTSGYGNNRLEGTPHGPVHVYVGGENATGQGGDMSDFATAGRDPIFFGHHGNLDRLWEIWRKDPAHRASEPNTDAFLQHEFPFTWIDGTTITVKVSDCMDTTKLGYVYDNLDVLRPGAPPPVSAQAAQAEPAPVARGSVKAPVGAQAAGSRRYVLEITGVAEPKRLLTVTVRVRPTDAPATDRGIDVGVFSAVRAGDQMAWPSTTLQFDVTSAVARYGGKTLDVQLIPNIISAQAAQPYPTLPYDSMRIFSEDR